MPTATSSTVAQLLVEIADALNETGEGADLYSILAPLVIAGYAGLNRSEIGFQPSAEFGLCGGRIPGTPAQTVQSTVDMFMKVAKDLGWDRKKHRTAIDLDAVDLQYRFQQLGMRMHEAGYPIGTWRVEVGGRGSNVLGGFEDVNDPRVLYMVSQLEKAGNVASLNPNAVDVIASHMLTTYDAGLTDTGRGCYVATARVKR